MPIITGADLASYPGVTTPEHELNDIAAQASALVEEAWVNPVTPAPQWVKTIATNAALRVHWNPKGLQSWTRSVDDASRTERTAVTEGRVGLYLTDDETARLSRPAATRHRVGSIRTRVPGYPK